MITTVLSIIYILIVIISIATIILFGAKPSKSLAWIVVILLIPIGGVLAYSLFGVNRRKFKFFTLKKTSRMKIYDQEHKDTPPIGRADYDGIQKYQRLATLINNNSYFPPYNGNEVKLLMDGETTFDTIFEALRNAKKFIHIQYYILEDGQLLEKLYHICASKVKEGVEVRIMYDSVGSLTLSNKTKRKFKKAGVHLYSVMPFRFGSFIFTLNYRNHRKIIIIDGEIGFTGGFNISDKYLTPDADMGIWDDMHLMLHGPVVPSLHRVFAKDYYFASEKEDLLFDKYFPHPRQKGDHIVQIVASGPDSDHSAVMQQYAMLIHSAEKSVSIANPYFIPNATILEALKIASLSGIEVKLLVPEKSDSFLTKFSMFSFFEELLEAGVIIYKNKEKFLHSKLIMIDEEVASVGSGNFDNRSFEQNFEVNALLYDPDLTQKLKKDFDNDCQNSVKLELDIFRKRPWHHKLLEGIARLFSPLL